MTINNQTLATAIISYVCAIIGLTSVVPSGAIKLFKSENTTLNRVMTENEIALSGSISFGSSFLITPFCAYLMDLVGRKRSIILFFLPQLLTWILLVSIQRVESFICAMFLSGLSTCTYLIVPVFIHEFCDPCIRGALSSIAMTCRGVGILISYCLGGILNYDTLNYTVLSLAALGLVFLLFLRESPLYLIRKGLKEEAAQSIAFYRGVDSDSAEVITHIENLKRIIENSLKMDDIPEAERLKPGVNDPKKKLSIMKFLKESSSSRRALGVLLIIQTASTLQGLIVVQILAGPLFSAAIPSISSTQSSIIFGVVLVLSGLLVAYLIEAVGRRMLLIVSSIVTGVFCIILGIKLQFQWGPGWLTALLIYIYTITYTMGAGTVPFVLIGEIFLPEIKCFASTLAFEWSYICCFVILYTFTPLYNAFGLGPHFLGFAGFSFFTALFVFFFLPETKNLPVDVIQQRFLQRKYK